MGHTQIFKPMQRVVPVAKLVEEVEKLCFDIEVNVGEAESAEDYLTVKALKEKQRSAQVLLEESQRLTTDDVTDAKYQFEDQKRKLAQEIDALTKDKRIKQVKQLYSEEKDRCSQVVDETGNDPEKKALSNILTQESVFLSSNSPSRIQEKTQALRDLRFSILWRTPTYLIWLFNHLLGEQARLNNQEQARICIDAGKSALNDENYEKLAAVNNELLGLLPKKDQEVVKSYTGITTS